MNDFQREEYERDVAKYERYRENGKLVEKLMTNPDFVSLMKLLDEHLLSEGMLGIYDYSVMVKNISWIFHLKHYLNSTINLGKKAVNDLRELEEFKERLERGEEDE